MTGDIDDHVWQEIITFRGPRGAVAQACGCKRDGCGFPFGLIVY